MEDSSIKKIVEKGLYKKAPKGMMDRVMANLAVNPARRISIKPIEPKPIIALLLPLIMAAFLAIGFWLKPSSIIPKSWNLTINLTINPVWVAPIVVVAMAVWSYIIFINKQTSKT